MIINETHKAVGIAKVRSDDGVCLAGRIQAKFRSKGHKAGLLLLDLVQHTLIHLCAYRLAWLAEAVVIRVFSLAMLTNKLGKKSPRGRTVLFLCHSIAEGQIKTKVQS